MTKVENTIIKLGTVAKAVCGSGRKYLTKTKKG
jgi:hypothetical protein